MCSIYAAFSEIQRDLANKLKSIHFAELAEKETQLQALQDTVKQQQTSASTEIR